MKHSLKIILKSLIPKYTDDKLLVSFEDGDYSITLYGDKIRSFDVLVILCRNNITRSDNLFHAYECSSYSEVVSSVRSESKNHELTTNLLINKVMEYIRLHM